MLILTSIDPDGGGSLGAWVNDIAISVGRRHVLAAVASSIGLHSFCLSPNNLKINPFFGSIHTKISSPPYCPIRGCLYRVENPKPGHACTSQTGTSRHISDITVYSFNYYAWDVYGCLESDVMGSVVVFET